MSLLPEQTPELGRDLLKQLKDGFDDPSLDPAEDIVVFNVRRNLSGMFRTYGGELVHQIALRKERRGEIDKAQSLYVFAHELLEGNALAHARLMRDWGTMLIKHVDQVEGYRMVEKALSMHAHDLPRASIKGRAKKKRQRLITESYLWRSQVLIRHELADEALGSLIELVKQRDFQSFCERDRKVIIDFLVPRTVEAERLDMLTRQAEIHVSRRNVTGFARTCATFAFDVQLSVVRSMARRFLR